MNKCIHCKEGCCPPVLLMSPAEIVRIKRYVKGREIKINKNPKQCPFRDDEGRNCQIYAVRPDMCRCFVCNDQAATTAAMSSSVTWSLTMRGPTGSSDSAATSACSMPGIVS